MPDPTLPDDDLVRTARAYMARLSSQPPPNHLADDAVKFAISRRRRVSLAALLGGSAVIVAGAAAAVLALAFHHGPVAGIPAVTPTPSATTAPTGPTPGGVAPTPAATPTPAPPPPVIVWAVQGPSGMIVRAGHPSGPFHTVKLVPASAAPTALGAGGHRLLFWEATTGHVYDLDITTGTITDHGGAPGLMFWGAAFSPDGQRVEYLRQTAENQAGLRMLDFSTGAITPLRSFTANPFDVPVAWGSGGVAARRYAQSIGESPQPGFDILDPSTGARIATTQSSVFSAAIAADGKHAAQTEYISLSNVAGPGSSNTLCTVDIGSPVVPVLKEKDHQLQVQAVSPAGSTILYSDNPGATTNTAGISASPDYGLFTFANGKRTQVAHENGGSYSGGAFLNATDFVVIDVSGPGAKLLRGTGGSLMPLDSATGAQGWVYVVSG